MTYPTPREEVIDQHGMHVVRQWEGVRWGWSVLSAEVADCDQLGRAIRDHGIEIEVWELLEGRR